MCIFEIYFLKCLIRIQIATLLGRNHLRYIFIQGVDKMFEIGKFYSSQKIFNEL